MVGNGRQMAGNKTKNHKKNEKADKESLDSLAGQNYESLVNQSLVDLIKGCFNSQRTNYSRGATILIINGEVAGDYPAASTISGAH